MNALLSLLTNPAIVSSIGAALIGAVIGGYISHKTTISRDGKGKRIKLVGEFASLYSKYEAALVRFQIVRVEDESVSLTNNSKNALCNLYDVDAEAQRIYWEFCEAFNEERVIFEIWEYLRRISITKQMLLVTKSPKREFAEAMTWLYFQGLKTIEVCSQELKINTAPERKPFFLGISPIIEQDSKRYNSPKEPW